MCTTPTSKWAPRVIGIVCGILILTIAIVTATVLLTRNTTKQVSAEKPESSVDSQLSSSSDSQQSSQILSNDPHVIQSDHIAHAVPGRQYFVTDLDGDGKQIVQLDASRSHSHFFDQGPPSKLAKIINWTWDIGDKKAVSFSSTPDLIFPVGTTKVSLLVEDDYGYKHRDTTNVTVLPHLKQGVYCYYYNTIGDDGSFSLDDNRFVGLKPILGEHLDVLDFQKRSQFPKIINQNSFQVRCTFHIKSDGGITNFEIQHDGPIKLMIERSTGVFPIIEELKNGKQISKGEFNVQKGLELIQLMYLVSNSESTASLKLIQPKKVYHDLATQVPLIYSIDPPNSTLKGGGYVTVQGSGLWNDPQLYFGTNPVTPDEGRSTPDKIVVVVPSSKKEGEIEITVGNKWGGSNILPFLYSNDAFQPIRFKQVQVKNSKDQIFKIRYITNLIFGPDLRLYMASLDSFVHSISIDRNLKAKDLCTSPSLGEDRVVIGLAFNPSRYGKDDELLLYASSSIFFWKRANLTMDKPWANGQIHKLLPNYNDECIGIVGNPIITGLPVSNHDHGVNGLLFTDDGRLLIQVGGATNAGVPAIEVGGIDESPLSGASLYAHVTKSDFDGKIEYDNADPSIAKQINGDVYIYSAGWRNSFGLTQHLNGFIYATDNGANSEFGNWSTSCTTDAAISPYHSDDKLGKIIEGRYGGHPNRNRAREDEEQCIWRNPFDAAQGNFIPPMGTFESSTDGIIEYTAHLFDGQMKGNLLLSKYSTNDPENDGRVYRVKLDNKGELTGEIESLWEASGLSIAMTPWGDLVMPRLYDSEILGLKAIYESRKKTSLISLWPNRGPLEGGNQVLIVGEKLNEKMTALFDGKACSSTKKGPSESTFWCIVPSGKAGSVQVNLKMEDASIVETSKGFDYRYMKI